MPNPFYTQGEAAVTNSIDTPFLLFPKLFGLGQDIPFRPVRTQAPDQSTRYVSLLHHVLIGLGKHEAHIILLHFLDNRRIGRIQRHHGERLVQNGICRFARETSPLMPPLLSRKEFPFLNSTVTRGCSDIEREVIVFVMNIFPGNESIERRLAIVHQLKRSNVIAKPYSWRSERDLDNGFLAADDDRLQPVTFFFQALQHQVDITDMQKTELLQVARECFLIFNAEPLHIILRMGGRIRILRDEGSAHERLFLSGLPLQKVHKVGVGIGLICIANHNHVIERHCKPLIMCTMRKA